VRADNNPRAKLLSLHCLGHGLSKLILTLRDRAQRFCKSFLLMQQSASSFVGVKVRSVPIRDSEQGSTMRQGALLRCCQPRHFSRALCRALEPQGPGSQPHIPCLGTGASVGEGAAEREPKLDLLSTVASHGENPTFHRAAEACMSEELWLARGGAATLLIGLLIGFGGTWASLCNSAVPT
jgi:hypothetical protein